MTALIHALVPIIVIVVIALIIWRAAERFSPDAFITKVVLQTVVFAVVLMAILLKLVPLLGIG